MLEEGVFGGLGLMSDVRRWRISAAPVAGATLYAILIA
jgi:hypothetical protein